MARLENTWAKCLSELPETLRPHAHALPWKLGLTRLSPQGWEAFWTFDPNRRPAHYVLATAVEEELRDARVESFDEAHHRAVFYGLLFDRLVDGQAEASPERDALREALHEGWIASLAQACGDRALAESSVAEALLLLEEGTEIEADSIRRRHLDPATYAVQTRMKLRWCSATPRVMAQQLLGEDRTAAYRRCFDLFGMAVQCMDDAIDAEQDRELHGISVPGLLGVEDASLVFTGSALAKEAAAAAHSAGFFALGEWLGRLDRFFLNARVEGDRGRLREEGSRLAEAIMGAL